MKIQDIINKVISNKDLKDSPSLMFWIQKSHENRNEYIAYKNIKALLQSGAEMPDRVIKKDLETVYKTNGKFKSSISRNIFLNTIDRQKSNFAGIYF